MLDAKRLGLAGGIVWSLSVAFMVILAWVFGMGNGFITLFSSIYLGLDVSILGLLLGLIYGFIDGFIGFFLIAWVYNKLA